MDAHALARASSAASVPMMSSASYSGLANAGDARCRHNSRQRSICAQVRGRRIAVRLVGRDRSCCGSDVRAALWSNATAMYFGRTRSIRSPSMRAKPNSGVRGMAVAIDHLGRHASSRRGRCRPTRRRDRSGQTARNRGGYPQLNSASAGCGRAAGSCAGSARAGIPSGPRARGGP